MPNQFFPLQGCWERNFLQTRSGKAPGIAHSQPGPPDTEKASSTSKLLSHPHQLLISKLPKLRNSAPALFSAQYQNGKGTRRFSISNTENWTVLSTVQSQPSRVFKLHFCLELSKTRIGFWETYLLHEL